MGVGDPICFGLRARAAAVIERRPAFRAALAELAPWCEREQIEAVEGMRDGAAIAEREGGGERKVSRLGRMVCRVH